GFSPIPENPLSGPGPSNFFQHGASPMLGNRSAAVILFSFSGALLSGGSPSVAQQTKTGPGTVRSHVTLINADGSAKQVILSTERHFEAPNWSPDGKYLLLNSEGKLWKLAVSGGQPEPVETGAVKGINNDHGIAPDGRQIAISAGQIFI